MAYQPKSYRKFLATSVAAAMVATVAAPMASAADQKFSDVSNQWFAEHVDYLVAKNVLDGFSDGTFRPGHDVTRAQAAKMIVESLGLELPTTVSLSFPDTKNDVWYSPYVAVLVEKGILQGKPNGNFDPNGKITRAELAKIVVEAYDLKKDESAIINLTDVVAGSWYEGYVNTLYSLGVVGGKSAGKFVPGDNVTRAEAAAFLHRTEVEEKRLEVAKSVLAVRDVTITNAKDLVVSFNKAVDTLTAEHKGNYEVKINNDATTEYSLTVDEKDPTKVHLVLADGKSLSNGAFVTVTVKKDVLDKDLKALPADVTKIVTFADTSAPVIEKIEVEGENLKVTFNEYVSNVDLVRVNGVVKALQPTANFTKTLVITEGAKGLGNGTHTVSLANVSDIVKPTANVATFLTGTFTIAENTTNPTVSKIESVTDNKFKLVFNTEVTKPAVTVKKNGLDLTVEYPEGVETAKEWIITVKDNGGVKLYNSNENSVGLAVNVSAFRSTANYIVGDVYTANVTLSKDTTPPTVLTRFNTIVDNGVNGEVFHIRFNEAIEATADAANKIILTDKDGVRQPVTSAWVTTDGSSNNTVLVVRSTAVQESGKIKAGTYNISLGTGTVKDLAGNNNAATNVTITKSGTTSGTLEPTVEVDPDVKNLIVVDFGATMTNSATNLSNYMIDNKPLPAGTAIYFEGSTRFVKIQLPTNSVTNSAPVLFSIADDVVSTNGQKVASAKKNQILENLTDNVAPTLVSAKKVSTTQIELTFSEALSALDANLAVKDFVVEVNGFNLEVVSHAAISSGATKVVLTVAPYNTAQTVTVATNKDNTNRVITDLAGNRLVKDTKVTATN